MKQKTEPETFSPANRQEWRQWLADNHLSKQSIWLICYKKKANIPTISWSDAVSEALCFGWIDSVRKTHSEDSFKQFFGRRKPNGTWSKVNKEKVIQLIEAGLMAQAGLESIEKAKQNGSWHILDEVEELNIPNDLNAAFLSHPGALDFYLSLSKSLRKRILQWIVLAKRSDTRQNRIGEIAQLAAQGRKPKQF